MRNLAVGCGGGIVATFILKQAVRKRAIKLTPMTKYLDMLA